jgi:dihydrodipicolinate synthase/N-acetylneuraminate lyase
VATELRRPRPKGAFAAAATPLRTAGSRIDEGAFESLTNFLIEGGLDGILPLGTTGEGILLSAAERKKVAELFIELAGPRLAVVVHCGGQSTAETVDLARHASEANASGVAVIGPPYFQLDDKALLGHFAEAARACAPTPFYVYELEKASGYSVPLGVLHELRNVAPNFVGMKVSDTPWERFQPYLIDGLDIFVGAEGLIQSALAAGAVGAVSALATAFPEAVSVAVREADEIQTARLAQLRAEIECYPRHAALKHVLRRRGVAIEPDVRPPLRQLTEVERAQLDGRLADWLDLSDLARTEDSDSSPADEC